MKLEVPLALDFGVAVFPEDADQKETLVRLADERLYQLKNAMRTPAPRVVEMEPSPIRAAAEAVTRPVAAEPLPARPAAPVAPPRVAAAAAASPVPQPVAAAPANWSEARKWERVSLVGTRAYAVLSNEANRSARVMDLSYGGVALQIEPGSNVPVNFQAVLHVPILPPVKVNLRKVYEQTEAGIYRIGCSFVS